MKTPFPPGPNMIETCGKMLLNVRTWARNSSMFWPYGIHSIITPLGVRRLALAR